MKVLIDDVIIDGELKGKIFIESDSIEYRVTKIVVRTKDGVDTGSTQVLGHFVNLESCVKYLVNMKIKESTATNLAELVQELKIIKASIHIQLGV